MMQIQRYEIRPPDTKVKLPVGCKILCVMVDEYDKCLGLYVLGDTDAEVEEHLIVIVPTSCEVCFTASQYIGSVSIGHVFDVEELR